MYDKIIGTGNLVPAVLANLFHFTPYTLVHTLSRNMHRSNAIGKKKKKNQHRHYIARQICELAREKTFFSLFDYNF